MLQWWLSKVHASITMAMTWHWKENKVGRHKQTNKKKRQNPGKQNAQKKKTQRDIHQHKHWSKWLTFILHNRIQQRNEKQHNKWIKYASENWSSKKTEHVQFNQAVFLWCKLWCCTQTQIYACSDQAMIILSEINQILSKICQAAFRCLEESTV